MVGGVMMNYYDNEPEPDDDDDPRLDAHERGAVGLGGPRRDLDAASSGARTYAIVVCMFASLGGLFFGFDQGVTGGVLVMRSFLNDFCVGWNGQTLEECSAKSANLPERWLDFTLWYNMTYNIGCIFGALLGGYIADAFGRRLTVFNASLLFCIGNAWLCVCPAKAHSSILVARVLQGVGVGNSSFSLPIFGAEMAPKELRGLLSGFMQMTCVMGLLVANVVNVIVEDHARGWRISNGVAMAAPIIVMFGIFFVPESPRWTYQRRGKDAAEAVLMQLRQTTDVRRELRAIGDQIARGGDGDGGGSGIDRTGHQRPLATWRDVLEPSVLKRVLIAMALQVLQQATGINPMFTYGGLIFKDVVGNGILSVLVLSVVNFVSTIPAMRWVDTYGRRQLLLIGAVGMVLGHVVSGVTFTLGCNGNTDDSGCAKGAGIVIITGSAFFIFHFAISWGPVCWIYPAEIFPLHVRAKAVSLSTMANWVMGTCMTWVVKLFPSLNIDGVFFLFSGTCVVAFVFVYWLCPETKGMLLEDIEALFYVRAAAPPVVGGAAAAMPRSNQHPHQHPQHRHPHCHRDLHRHSNRHGLREIDRERSRERSRSRSQRRGKSHSSTHRSASSSGRLSYYEMMGTTPLGAVTTTAAAPRQLREPLADV